MANIGRDTKLIKDGNVIAGVRIINVDWQSESVDISEGESDGYRLLAEIDGLTTIDIQCEGITKDHELQEIAYSRSQSRLLKDVTLELPRPEGGIIEVTLDLYIDSLSANATYNDAISFAANFTASAIISNGEIVNIDRDPITGQITGTPGYGYDDGTISCVSNFFNDTYWVGSFSGDYANWTGSYWEAGTIVNLISLTEVGTWVEDYRPTKLRITALVSGLNNIAAGINVQSGGGSNLIVNGLMTLNSTPESFEFDCDFQDDLDIFTLNLQVGSFIEGLQLTCIEFE